MRQTAHTLGVAPAALLSVFGFAGFELRAAPGAPPTEQILYQSIGLKIYRTTSLHGTPIVVLTNLDEQGNYLSPHGGPDVKGVHEPRAADADVTRGALEPPASHAVTPGEGRATGGVSVIVRQGGDAVAGDETDVEVQSDNANGTTVIININAPTAPQTQRPVVSVAPCPLVVYGGLPGWFHYPDRLPFLGYGTTNDTPVFFGGLGLSSTARYARAAGGSCKSGPGCPRGFRDPAP